VTIWILQGFPFSCLLIVGDAVSSVSEKMRRII